jgi:hypothetical protein
MYDPYLQTMITTFCDLNTGYHFTPNTWLDWRGDGSYDSDSITETYITISIWINTPANCDFNLNNQDCMNIFTQIYNDCEPSDGGGYTLGGKINDNCGQWQILGYDYPVGDVCTPTLVEDYCQVNALL